MSIEIEDYNEKLTFEKNENVIFLPVSINKEFKGEKKVAYYESTLNIMKIFKQNNINSEIAIGSIENCIFVDNRSLDWLCPTIFVSYSLLSQNPAITSVILNIISNYVYDLFKGRKDDPNIKCSVVVERKNYSKKIKYEGPVSGLKEFEKIVNGQ